VAAGLVHGNCSEHNGFAHTKVAGIGAATEVEQMFTKREEAS
jgi:hypothetical protein